MSDQVTLLPKKWNWVSLKDLGIVSNESIIPSNFPDEVFELWSVPNYDIDKPEYVRGMNVGSNKCKVRENDILLCKINPRINRVWKVRKGSNYRQIASTEWIIIRNDHISQDFLTYQLRSSRIRDEMLKNVSGVGGSLMRARPNAVKELKIALPPIEIQGKIASKLDELLSELDKGVESLRIAQQQLKIYRQSVLKWAFAGSLTNKNLKEGELPEGWEMDRLGNYIEGIDAGRSYKCDERPPSGGEIGIVKVSSVTWGYFDDNESKTCFSNDLFNPKYKINVGDFLFSRANTIELIGACVIVHKMSKNLMLSDKILRISVPENLLKKYMLYYLRCPSGRKEIENRSTGNQESMRNIGQEKIKQIEFPYCPQADQIEVVESIESRLSVADKLEETIVQSLQQAEPLRRSILKKAFEGKLI